MAATDVLRGFARDLLDIPGWATKRHMVVFLVDDYGSIRMPSLSACTAANRFGIGRGECRYARYDALESNADLEGLFEVLVKYSDHNGHSPAFSPVALVGNPDFEKIGAGSFERYYWEPFTVTLRRYPAHDRVLQLWKEGIERQIFVPEFHGREHVNVARWMRDLRSGVESTRAGFQLGMVAANPHEVKGDHWDYQAALDLDTPEDWRQHEGILREGLSLFRDMFGFGACLFTPPGGLYSHRLDDVLSESGIRFVSPSRLEKEPMGGGRVRRRLRFMGFRNRLGQRYVIRTAQFEPSADGAVDWVDRCLDGVARAFRWGKPATISSHRVNFSGHLVPENRARGLRELDRLLAGITSYWPDVEFLTMRDLGAIMGGQAQEQP